MNFEQALTRHVGRRVEVFLTNSLVQGTLLGASGGLISVAAVNSDNSAPSGRVDIVKTNAKYVRVFVV